MQFKKQQLELDMEQQTNSNSGKEFIKAVTCLFNLCRVHHANARLNESHVGINARRNINNLTYADDTTLRADRKEELKSLLMEEKESEKAGSKLSIQKRRS